MLSRMVSWMLSHWPQSKLFVEEYMEFYPLVITLDYSWKIGEESEINN